MAPFRFGSLQLVRVAPQSGSTEERIPRGHPDAWPPASFFSSPVRLFDVRCGSLRLRFAFARIEYTISWTQMSEYSIKTVNCELDKLGNLEQSRFAWVSCVPRVHGPFLNARVGAPGQAASHQQDEPACKKSDAAEQSEAPAFDGALQPLAEPSANQLPTGQARTRSQLRLDRRSGPELVKR